MALDLSALEIDLEAPSPAAASGKPLELAIDQILEDPKNARRDYDAVKMAELTASVADKGVKSPISVKPHPTIPGKYQINHGHRRFRASKAAGRTHVPAFIDEMHDDYDQVVENLQREDLTPLELAMFIAGKLEEGEKKGQVAQKLGKKPAMITEHLALIDPPGTILDLYRKGLLTSPRTIYDLRHLYEKYPEQVQMLLDAYEGEIERRTVDQWAAAIKNPASAPAEGTGLRHDENSGTGDAVAPAPASGAAGAPEEAAGTASAAAASQASGQTAPATDPGNQGTGKSGQGGQDGEGEGESESESEGEGEGGTTTVLLPHNTAHEKALGGKAPATPDPTRLKKPVMLVEYEGRAAMVLLWNRPSTAGLLRIKFEDNSEEEEVDAGRCKINCLLEATA